MEAGLLNFHDEENFSTAVYDQEELIGIEGHRSLLEMMHSDFQYGSDYLNQSITHWDCDQEQEHNGDIAVLPTPPSECSNINNSKEDYHKVFFEWQEHLLSLQPLGPDDVDLRLDGQAISEELPDNIFEDSFETKSCVIGDFLKTSLSGSSTPLSRTSTPVPICSVSSPSKNKLNTSIGSSCTVSLSTLDVNLRGIDVSALGINVSTLDLKSEQIKMNDVKPLITPEHESSGWVELGSSFQGTNLKEGVSVSNSEVKNITLISTHSMSTEIFDSRSLPFSLKEGPNLLPDSNVLSGSKMDLMYSTTSKCVGKKADRGVLKSPSKIKVEPAMAGNEKPALEAGNVESLLEQFEAVSVPSCSQSMPTSPASPLSMPASPSSLPLRVSEFCVKSKPLKAVTTSRIEVANLPQNQFSPAKRTSLLRSNNVDSLAAFGRKKGISLLPPLPSKRAGKSGTRMQDAGAALNRNKLLKIVSQKSTSGEFVQLDHDYCSSDNLPSFYNSDPLEYIPQNLVLSIRANQRHGLTDDDKCSRKDSGLESGEVSEDSEGALIPSGASSGCETGGSGIYSISKSLLKPRVSKSNKGGKSKDPLMVSVLKKTKSEIKVCPAVESGTTSGQLLKSEDSSNVTAVKPPVSSPVEVKEQPKKRKLNLEEYRNRQKAMERERANKCSEADPESAPVVQQEPLGGSDQVLETPTEEVTEVSITLVNESKSDPADGADRRRRRQYRMRRASTSSSEGDSDQTQVFSEKIKVKSTKKKMLSRSRSRSHSRAISCARSSSSSRSSSRSSSSSCTSSSSSSSSNSSHPVTRSRKGSYTSRSRSRSHHRSRRRRTSYRSHGEHSLDWSWRSKRHQSLKRVRSRSRGGDRASLHTYSFSPSRSRRSSTRSRSRSRGCRSSNTRSRSRSGDRSRRSRRSRSRSVASSSCHDQRWIRSSFRSVDKRARSRKYSDDSKRSRSPSRRQQESIEWFRFEKEHNRQVEERRVIYVGRIPENITKSDLRARFELFGPVVDIRLHFRDHADNYGFVTFAYKVDAYEAVEHGNDAPNQPHFDLCFGGRRKFCKERYADLDGMACKSNIDYKRRRGSVNEKNSFDQMLREAQEKLRDRKKL